MHPTSCFAGAAVVALGARSVGERTCIPHLSTLPSKALQSAKGPPFLYPGISRPQKATLCVSGGVMRLSSLGSLVRVLRPHNTNSSLLIFNPNNPNKGGGYPTVL